MVWNAWVSSGAKKPRCRQNRVHINLPLTPLTVSALNGFIKIFNNCPDLGCFLWGGYKAKFCGQKSHNVLLTSGAPTTGIGRDRRIVPVILAPIVIHVVLIVPCNLVQNVLVKRVCVIELIIRPPHTANVIPLPFQYSNRIALGLSNGILY